MDMQVFFNTAIGVVGALGMWILLGIKDSLNALHKADMELTAKVQSIELLVAGNYVKKDEVEKLGNALFFKLDKIDAKLDLKADKAHCDQIRTKGTHT